MKVLITGVGGFVGGSLMREFMLLGHSVIGLFRRTPPEVSQTDKVHLIKCDLRNEIDVDEEVDVVIHAAAHTPATANLQTTTSDYIQSNIVGTMSLINLCKKRRPKLFVYLSSVSIYGKVHVSSLDEATPFHEPELYGTTKYAGELILKEAAGSFPVISVRLPGVVGKNYFVPWLGRVLRQASQDESIVTYNPHSLFNNITDPIELTRFIFTALNQNFQGYEMVNFAAAQPIKLMNLLEEIVSRLKSKSKILISKDERNSFWIKTDKLEKRFQFIPSNTITILDRYIRENVDSFSVSCDIDNHRTEVCK